MRISRKRPLQQFRGMASRLLPRIRLSGVVFVVSLFAFAPPIQAEVSLTLSEDDVTQFLRQVPAPAGTGTKRFTLPYPCPSWQNPFRTCRKTIVSGRYSWQLSDIRFDSRPSGPVLRAQLRAFFIGLTYRTDVSGPIDVRIDGGILRLRVNRIRVPIRFDIPLLGRRTITTVTSRPDVSFNAEIDRFFLPGFNTYGVFGRLRGLDLQFDASDVTIRALAIPRGL